MNLSRLSARSAIECIIWKHGIYNNSITRLLSIKQTKNFQQSARVFLSSQAAAPETQGEPIILKREYEYMSGVEHLEHYRPGGYHPVKIRDSLCDGRYTILHKLGFGGRSTIWLAVDKHVDQLVAIKIKTAESIHDSAEAKILSKLAGEFFVQKLLNVFNLTGPNGTHECLVLEVAQCSLATAKERSGHRLLYLPMARAVAASVILGVQNLHARGIVHGDLHVGNFLLPMSENLRRTTDPVSLYAKIGEPCETPPVRLDGAPLSPGVPPQITWDAAMKLRSDQITTGNFPVMIADFGESLEPATTKRLHAHTLPALRPPESFFTKPNTALDSISFASDIWTLSCSIWEILGSGPPFCTWGTSRDELLVQHVELIGKLPEPWWSSWETRDECLDEQEDGLHILHQKRIVQNWGNRKSLEKCYNWFITEPRDRTRNGKSFFKDGNQSVDEKKAFLDLMQAMLVHEPCKRATIDDVVES